MKYEDTKKTKGMKMTLPETESQKTFKILNRSIIALTNEVLENKKKIDIISGIHQVQTENQSKIRAEQFTKLLNTIDRRNQIIMDLLENFDGALDCDKCPAAKVCRLKFGDKAPAVCSNFIYSVLVDGDKE